MTKLDWSKGYTPDPARTQSEESTAYAAPSASSAKKKTNFWSVALKRLSPAKKPALSQATLLRALGVSLSKQRSSKRGALLKKYIREGILLGNGLPNMAHPAVQEIIAHRTKSKKISK